MAERAVRFLLAVSFALAASAAAAERTPAQRQGLADLAYALGESHALRQACEGEGDQYWRARMQQLMELEEPDQAFAGRLAGAFNSGFAQAQASFPSCGAKSRAAAVRAAAKGRRLAALLGNS
ncbi:MAG TPA: TIGR02301 family protein [Caulobacteraceae bacterium]|jgi:uncharacterized protein (TIGR02301 family)